MAISTASRAIPYLQDEDFVDKVFNNAQFLNRNDLSAKLGIPRTLLKYICKELGIVLLSPKYKSKSPYINGLQGLIQSKVTTRLWSGGKIINISEPSGNVLIHLSCVDNND